MIKTLNTKNTNFQKKLENKLLLRKKNINLRNPLVFKILSDVKKNGDKALIKYEKRFNSNAKIIISKSDINKSIAKLNNKVKKAIDLAYKRIYAFHSKQINKGFKTKDKYGNKFEYKFYPIEKIGIYVPGSTANYPSTVLMNAIPALLANVKEIHMASPFPKGKLNSGVIYAAHKCKIKKIYCMGGAQAIAALAYGTKKIKKVNKIVGPGNKFVTSAKKEVFGEVGIDTIAGPSEITVVGDKNSNPDWVAADLISQAEHDKYSQSILISLSNDLLKKVKKSIIKQLTTLPRKKIAKYSLSKFGLLIKASSINEVAMIINDIAPEHLELNISKFNYLKNKIYNAGSVFLGKYSMEAIGDYLAGPNHVLPTTGAAKFSSGLSVNDFLKRISYVNLTKRGIETLGPSVITLSDFENLKGHSKSIKIRIKKKGFKI